MAKTQSNCHPGDTCVYVLLVLYYIYMYIYVCIYNPIYKKIYIGKNIYIYEYNYCIYIYEYNYIYIYVIIINHQRFRARQFPLGIPGSLMVWAGRRRTIKKGTRWVTYSLMKLTIWIIWILSYLSSQMFYSKKVEKVSAEDGQLTWETFAKTCLGMGRYWVYKCPWMDSWPSRNML
jgi:hypothetical protein